MRAYAVACLLGFASLSAVGAACNFKLGEDTKGDRGALRFAYSGGGDCLLGCPLDRQALQGSLVTISVKGNLESALRARVRAGDRIASVTGQQLSCTCTNQRGTSARSRIVEPGESCREGEAKSCSMSVDLRTIEVGDGKLEIVDAGGDLVDAVDVHVRTAHRIDVTVSVDSDELDPAKDGKLELAANPDSSFALAAKTFGADDEELFFTHDGVHFTYSDAKIVGPARDDVSATEIKTMRAASQGDTTVTVVASGAKKVVPFRITPDRRVSSSR